MIKTLEILLLVSRDCLWTLFLSKVFPVCVCVYLFRTISKCILLDYGSLLPCVFSSVMRTARCRPKWCTIAFSERRSIVFLRSDQNGRRRRRQRLNSPGEENWTALCRSPSPPTQNPLQIYTYTCVYRSDGSRVPHESIRPVESEWCLNIKKTWRRKRHCRITNNWPSDLFKVNFFIAGRE